MGAMRGRLNMAAYMLIRQANVAALAGDHAGVVQLAAAGLVRVLRRALGGGPPRRP